jgi:hypothetical protein
MLGSGGGVELVAGVLGQQHDPGLVQVRRQRPQGGHPPARGEHRDAGHGQLTQGSWVSCTHSIGMTGAPIVSVSWLASHRTVGRDASASRATRLTPPYPSAWAAAPSSSRRCRSVRCGATSEKVAASTSSKSTSRTYSNHSPWQGRQAGIPKQKTCRFGPSGVHLVEADRGHGDDSHVERFEQAPALKIPAADHAVDR